jgi:hypothetical protein
VLVELAAGDDVELTADRDDQAVAAALGRKPELRHLRLRISNPPGGAIASSYSRLLLPPQAHRPATEGKLPLNEVHVLAQRAVR